MKAARKLNWKCVKTGDLTPNMPENNQYPRFSQCAWQSEQRHNPVAWRVIFHSAGIRSVSAEQCDFCSYSSLPSANASPGISIRLLGECVSRILTREETHAWSESKARDGPIQGEKPQDVLRHQSSNFPEMRALSERSFRRRTKPSSCYSPGTGCITGPLALLGGNSTNCCSTKTTLNYEKTPTWCNTCEMDKSQSETGHIGIKGEKKGRKWDVWIWTVIEKNLFVLLSSSPSAYFIDGLCLKRYNWIMDTLGKAPSHPDWEGRGAIW